MLKGLLIFLSTIILSASVYSENGVTDKEVVVGMSNALEGPASALGQGVKKGAMVYIDKINAAGGVNGRKIKVISYDDGYEPKNTVENTKKLISTDKVFSLIGYVGTPTSKAIMPIIDKEKIPFVGPFTGAEFLRNPVNPYVFNVRGSYFDEAETQIEYLTKKLGLKKIGIFIQDDGYGLAVKGGIIKSLKDRGLNLVGEGRYKRNTTDVDKALEALIKANPEAVSMVGTYKAMAAFIKKAKAKGFTPKFLNVSFVGTSALIKELGADGDGVVISQVMPIPSESSLAIIKQYQEDMIKAGNSEFDYVTLEGYFNAVVFVEALKGAGKDITRDSFVNSLNKLDKDFGGLKVKYSANDHQGLKNIYLTEIKDGKVVDIK